MTMQRAIFILFFLFLCASQGVFAQNMGKTPNKNVGIIYNRETTFNSRIATNRSLSFGMEFGRLRTYYKTTFYYASLGEMKHPKEQRQSAPPSTRRSYRPYVFGKQNALMVARGGWGVKRYYSEKAKKKGVAIGAAYAAGPTLGLLKPYYLALNRTTGTDANGRVSHEKYSAENADLFLQNTTKILGASAFSRGLKEISILPGGNVSAALHFDWGAFDEFVKALEIGVQADVFIRKAPILISEENNQIFINFFINFQFGKRK
jgi:hypothetical protein